LENTKIIRNGRSNIWRLCEKAEAVLFDLDGVIIDSDSLHNEAKKVTLEYYGLEVGAGDWERIRHHATSQIYEWLADRDPEIKVTKNEFLAYKSHYFAKFAATKIKLVSGVLLFIQSLKEHGVKLALVTATRRGAFDIFCEKFGLEGYFGVVVTGEDVKNLKPDPEAYLMAAGLLGSRPENCIVIEDTAVGVQSGKAAGCMVVGRESTLSKKVLIEAGADAVFKDFAD